VERTAFEICKAIEVAQFGVVGHVNLQYFLTIVFATSKWMLKKVDRIRRGFLWKGSEIASGGHYLVHWGNVQKPKKVGGRPVQA
jgi:hypothetical protein